MHPILLPKGVRIGLRYLCKLGYGKRKDDAPAELSATRSYPAKLQIKLSSDAIGTIIADRPRTEPYGRFYAYGSHLG